MKIRMNMKRIFSLFMTVCILFTMFPMAVFADTYVHTSCTLEEDCLVCEVATKVNNLPDAEEITIDNAASVQQQIFDIDKIKFSLGETEYDEFTTLVEMSEDGYDVVKYNEAVEAIGAITGGGTLVVAKKYDLQDGSENIDVSEAMALFEVVNTETNQVTNLSLFTSPLNSYADTSDVYTANSDGWTYKYHLPVGTYKITEVGLDEPTIIDGESFTTGVVYTNEELVNGATIEITEGSETAVIFSNSLTPEEEITTLYIEIESEFEDQAYGTITILDEEGTEIKNFLFSEADRNGISLDSLESGEYTVIIESSGLKPTEDVIFTYDADTKKISLAEDNQNDNASILGDTLTLELEYNTFNIKWVDMNGNQITTSLYAHSIYVAGEDSNIYMDENGSPTKFTLGYDNTYTIIWDANFYRSTESDPEVTIDANGDVVEYTNGLFLYNDGTEKEFTALVEYDESTRTFTFRMVPVIEEDVKIYTYDAETREKLSGVGIALYGQTLDEEGDRKEDSTEDTLVANWETTADGIILRDEDIDLEEWNPVKLRITSVPDDYWQGVVDNDIEFLVTADGIIQNWFSSSLIEVTGDNDTLNIYFGKEVDTTITFVDESGDVVEGIDVTLVGEGYQYPVGKTKWTTTSTPENVTLVSGMKYFVSSITPYGYLLDDVDVMMKAANTFYPAEETDDGPKGSSEGVTYNEEDNVIYIPVMTNDSVTAQSVIMKDTIGIKDYKMVGQNNYIYLGTKDGEPMKWIVLNSQAGSASGNNDVVGLSNICHTNLETTAFEIPF